VPRTVTFQRKRANRRVVNEAALLSLLSEFGAVSVVEFNASSSLHEQLLTMRDTGLFVSVHTSNLANAPFLQPGSAVLEFIPVRAAHGGVGGGRLFSKPSKPASCAALGAGPRGNRGSAVRLGNPRAA
jgi:hypothetical protein